MTDPQAPAREQEIRERCEKATKGPWRARAEIDRGDDLQGTATLYTVCAGKEDWRDNKGHFHPDDARYVIDEIHVAGCGYDRDYGYPEGGIQRKEDASFIAHAREDVPYLLDALASLREDHARLQQSQQELAAELMAAINEPMYAGSRADWKYRAEAAESREAALREALAEFTESARRLREAEPNAFYAMVDRHRKKFEELLSAAPTGSAPTQEK